jgi:hypothetical protein
MTKFSLLFIAILFLGCKKSDTTTKSDITFTKKENTKVNLRVLPFFDFNEVIHYHKSITREEWLEIIKKEKNQTVDEKKLIDLLNNYLPEKSLNDKILINDIERLYPERRKIDNSKIKTLSNIYSEKFYGDFSLAACEPYYRDILIFKKQNKIVGISKVCFDCYLHSTIGTKRNTEQLGQNGDYAKLQRILN